MTQMKTFKNESIDAMERSVNFWLEQMDKKITVISTSNGTIPPSSTNKKMLHTTIVTFTETVSDNKMKILHD